MALPFVKHVSKSATNGRLTSILGVFGKIGYAFSLAVTALGENMKDGFLNPNGKGRE